MDLGLKDKVAWVTGSSRGIGRAIAMALAREGARLMITGRNAADVERTAREIGQSSGEGSAQGFVGDLQKEEGISACLKGILQKWGKLDILVANLGTGQGERGWQASDGEWMRLLEMNLLSGVRVARSAVPELTRSRGSILFVSSIAGLEHVGAPAAYEAAKSAVIVLSKHFSKLLAAEGIRVNVIAPGNVLFPGGTWAECLERDREGTEAMIQSQVPLRRFGRPEEIADAAVFLSSPKASFITGTCLVIDGGQTHAYA